jgi:hypothetical protein
LQRISAIESAEVRDLVWGFKARYIELVGRWGKDRASGIVRADKTRRPTLIEKARGNIKLGMDGSPG